MRYESSRPVQGIASSRQVTSHGEFDTLAQTAEAQGTAGDAGGARPLLDLRTQLATPHGRKLQTFGWKFTLWPGCAEASACIVTSGSTRYRAAERGREKSDDESAVIWQIANGRAATRSRRYFVTNRLRYMWVLTFANPPMERRDVMAEVAAFARALRVFRGGDSFPYWYSPELHPQGHGWHVNFFVPFRIDHSAVSELWGHGFVWVTDFASAVRGPKGEPLGLCRTPREGLRRAANYGCGVCPHSS